MAFRFFAHFAQPARCLFAFAAKLSRADSLLQWGALFLYLPLLFHGVNLSSALQEL